MIEVVIPAYNAGSFLRETLLSVATQSLAPGRVTVVDDSSTDNTVAIAESFAQEFQDTLDVRVIANAGPRGPSAARNTAIRRTEAGWIALLDADDLLAPGHHAALSRAVALAPDGVLAFGDSTVFAANGADRRTVVDTYFSVSGVATMQAIEVAPGALSLGEAMFPALLRNGIFGTSACLIRRDAALSAGLFNEAMMRCEDTDFFLRLALRGRFVFTREIVAHKRIHADNLSHARHKLAFCEGTAVSLGGLALQQDALGLSGAQRVALRRELRQSLNGYLYYASRDGFEAYGRAAALARRHGGTALAVSPRHLARLALTSLYRRPAR